MEVLSTIISISTILLHLFVTQIYEKANDEKIQAMNFLALILDGLFTFC